MIEISLELKMCAELQIKINGAKQTVCAEHLRKETIKHARSKTTNFFLQLLIQYSENQQEY